MTLVQSIFILFLNLHKLEGSEPLTNTIIAYNGPVQLGSLFKQKDPQSEKDQ